MSKARDLAGIFNLGPRSGTTAQRPSTAEVGDIFYNGTTGKTEIYTTTGWKEMASGIPFGNNAGRPVSPVIGQPYFNGEQQRLELYASTGWQNIVSETPGVVSVSGNYLESNASNTLEITGTNFTTGAVAAVIGTNGVEINASSTTVNSIVSISATFTGLSSQHEPYDLKVTNTSNLFGLLPDAIYVNQSPIWQTSSGSLGTFVEQVSISVSATASDPESTAISYALANGSSLPSGVTLNSSTGLISGTLPNITSNTTYTFTINASDGLNVIVPRTFSITSTLAPTISGGVLSSDSTYYYRTFTQNGTFSVADIGITADVLVIAGGGGGGSGWYAGGGGAGGVKLYSNQSLPIQSYSVVIGQGGAGTTDARNTSSNGENSSFGGSRTATGGGGAGSRNQRTNGARVGNNGGSGGGAAFPNTLGGFGVPGEGFDGGSNSNGGYGASGGGAGGAGNSGINADPYGSIGGIGTNSYASWLAAITPAMSSISGWAAATGAGYIGGGGAAGSDASVTRLGGLGGGGNGAQGGSVGATNGVSNTGGGGGGGSGTEMDSTPSAPQRGASGGSGLVVVRYTKASVGPNG